MNKSFLNEAFKQLDLLEEEAFELTDTGIDSLSSFMSSMDNVDDDEQAVIDPTATSPDDLANSYVGKVIVDCCVCHTKLYKDPSEVVVDEELGVANVGDECPCCLCTDGYKVVGEVAPYVEASVEVDVSAADQDGLTESGSSPKLPKRVGKWDLIVMDYKKFNDEMGLSREEVDDMYGTNGDLKAAYIYDDGNGESSAIVGVERRDGTLSVYGAHMDKDNVSSEEFVRLLTSEDVLTESKEASRRKQSRKVNEEINNIELDAGGQHIEIKSCQTSACGDEEIIPVSAKSRDQFQSKEELEFDFDDFDEEAFNELGESYLKEAYSNVESFKTSVVKTSGNQLVVEGVINFNSGKSRKTSFIFEAKDATKRGLVRFIGENCQISKGKRAFTLAGNIANKKFIAESFNYNYRASTNGESIRMYGTVRRKK